MGDGVGQRGGLKGVGDLQSNKGLPGINRVVTLFPIAQRRSQRQETQMSLKE